MKEEKNREEARGTTEERVQRVRLQEPKGTKVPNGTKGTNGPQKTESPQVLERMEVPVRPSDPIEESCDVKSDKPMSKEEETEVGHIPVAGREDVSSGTQGTPHGNKGARESRKDME